MTTTQRYSIRHQLELMADDYTDVTPEMITAMIHEDFYYCQLTDEEIAEISNELAAEWA